jgi:hypothetical protein
MTRRTIPALVLVLALCGTAHAAAQLFSPPMFPGANANLACSIVNVSSVTHTVAITALNSNGTTASTGFLTLSPLQAGVHLATHTAKQIPSTCAFSVNGEKTDFRAAVCVVLAAPTAGEIGQACLPAD